MTEQEKKKDVCNHEGGITLYRSSIDNKLFFHCHRCRTVIGPDFKNIQSAEKWAKDNRIPEFVHAGRT